MADVAVAVAGELRVVGLPTKQMTKPCLVDVLAGQLVQEDPATGMWRLVDADAAASAEPFGIVLRDQSAGLGVTALAQGKVEGFALGSRNFGSRLYNSVTAGAVADAAPASNGFVVGRVTSAWAQPSGEVADRLFLVECS